MSKFAELKDKLSRLERPFTVTLMSGKGGSGTSSLSASLAADFASQGVRTLLLDANLGLANQHILAGLSPVFSVEDVLSGACAIEEATIELSSNLSLLPARSGLLDVEFIPSLEMKQLVESLAWIRENFEIIIVDGGAGMSHRIATVAELTDTVLIVTMPDIAAIADSYAVAKYLLQGQSVSELGFIVNRAESDDEGKRTAENLLQMTTRFLDYDAKFSAYVLESDDFMIGKTLHGIPDPESWSESLRSEIRAVADAVGRIIPDDPSHWSGALWTPTRAISKLNNQMIDDDKIKRDSGTRDKYVHAEPELESPRKDSL
jgi:flagellar biosynthesis protein FlhG